MEYIKINRLRGDVADFTLTGTGLRITFAGKQPRNPPVDLSAEQCRRFLNELTEALEVFCGDPGNEQDDTQEEDGGEAE